MQSIGTWWMWAGFFIFIIAALTIDTFFLSGKKAHKVSAREALFWVCVWVSSALIFNVLLWIHVNDVSGALVANQKALEFFTGYIIEESLSVDNMFVFLMIFTYFSVPQEYQRRVLLYGVWSAIVFRFIMIVAGVWLVTKIHWILYVFGLFLVITGIKMLLFSHEAQDLKQNFILNWLRNHIRVTHEFHDDHFFIFQRGLWYATPLFLVLVLIEISDLVFALDSIPAVLAITQDSFIVVTSNIFAILGLRALYFLLADMASRFHLLKYGIAILLTFVGVKMLIAPWVKVPIVMALSIIVAILITTVILSLVIRPKQVK